MPTAKKKRKSVPKPRNPVGRSPLLRKGGAHAKTEQALRKKSKDTLRRQILTDEEKT